MSARRVERWLDLPPGAWHKRRLYALRLKSDAFGWLGFRRGDLVVIEPGASEQPGRVVVTRSQERLSLKRIASPAVAEKRMPTVLELPLRDRSERAARIVGTVIGLLRATGTGALRPVPLQPATRRRRRRESVLEALPRSETATASRRAGELKLEELQRIESEWRRWVGEAEKRQDDEQMSDLDRWRRLEHSLATLCDCLHRTHSDALRRALDAEARAVVAAIRDEMHG